MGRKRTTEEIIDILEKHGYHYIEEVYGGSVRKFIVEDDDGYKYMPEIGEVINGRKCAIAHKSNPFSIENIHLWLKLTNSTFSLLDDSPYEINSKKLLMHCSICDDDVYIRWGVLHNGGKCGVCRGLQVGKSNSLLSRRPDLEDEWGRNNKKRMDEYSFGSKQKVEWECRVCGNPWMATPYERGGKRNRGCPVCRESKGEKKIREILSKVNILYIRQYKFDDCRNVLPLPFDFYLPDYDLCIEYHGEQHYRVSRYDKDKNKEIENLKERKKRDRIKKKYCKNNNIPLLIIPYWDFDNISKILERTFQS